MAFNFNGDDSDTMAGYDTGEEPGEPILEEEGEPLVPGAPVEYVPEKRRESNSYVQDGPPQILETQEEDYEQVLSQVDRRMRVAHFYRSILDSTLFSEETSEAKIVQNRIRRFCNEELEVIFGMRQNTAALSATQFTAEEAEILKGLAAQVKLAKEAKIHTSQPMVKPTVNRVQTKPAPTVQTIQTQNKPAAPKPVAAAKPVPVQAKPSPKPPQAQPKAATNARVDLRIPERYRDDPTAKVMNGKVYIQARGDDHQLLWRTTDPKNGEPISTPVPIMRDVTPVAVPPHGSSIQPIPMPSIVGGPSSPFSMVMQQKASDIITGLDRVANIPGPGGAAARLIGGALTRSIASGGGDFE